MGRTERELDPRSGPVQHFAYDLRLLRTEAGSPSYRQLSRRAQYAPSVLSRAASGRELPSLNVTLAYVAACGGDAEAWRNRWTALAAIERGPAGAGRPAAPRDAVGTGQPAGPPAQSGTGQPAGPSAQGGAGLSQPPAGGAHPDKKPRRRRLARLPERLTIAGLSAALGATLVAVAPDSAPPPARARPPIAASTARPAPVVGPRDGLDPVVAGCAGDATTLAAASIHLPRRAALAHVVLRAGTVIGTVELRYSPHCRAGWSRVTPAGALDPVRTGTMEAVVSRASDQTYSAFGAAKVIEFYTDVLMMDGSCLRAAGAIVIAGVRGTARTACLPAPAR
jgi:hypothetical protein